MKILFVCNLGMNRSRTASDLVNKYGKHKAKFAGTNIFAIERLTRERVKWADIIFCMEEHNKEHLVWNFPKVSKNKDIRTMNIPDVYLRDGPDLIRLFKRRLKKFLK